MSVDVQRVSPVGNRLVAAGDAALDLDRDGLGGDTGQFFAVVDGSSRGNGTGHAGAGFGAHTGQRVIGGRRSADGHAVDHQVTDAQGFDLGHRFHFGARFGVDGAQRFAVVVGQFQPRAGYPAIGGGGHGDGRLYSAFQRVGA